MFVQQTEKIMPLKMQKKSTYVKISSPKTPISTQNKNNNKIIYEIINYKNNIKNSLNPRATKLIKNRIIAQKYGKNKTPINKKNSSVFNSIEVDSKRRTYKLNNGKKTIKNYYTNVYDINNNNYYVNLYETLTNIPSRKKHRNCIINQNSKEISRNQYYNNKTDNNYKLRPHKTSNCVNSISNILSDKEYLSSSVTIEMMKNYRNKLLKEFMKYMKKFYRYHYKEFFIYFINQLKEIQKRKTLSQFVYAKKFQKIPYLKVYKKISVKRKMTYNNQNKVIINRKNYNYSTLTDKKIDDDEDSIVSKIINNRKSELSDGKIRNIFLDSSFLNEKNSKEEDIYNIHTNSSIDNTSNNKKNINLSNKIFSPNISNISNRRYNTISTNSREIKINFRMINELKQEKNKKLLTNKIQIRNNIVEINDNEYNKKKLNSSGNKQSCEDFVILNLDSFYFITKQENKYSSNERRKKFITFKKNSNFLTSIKEEDEKFSLSFQDSITADNILHLKENTFTAQSSPEKMKLKSLIQKFIKEKYKKILLNKIKGITFAYKINKVFNKTETDKDKDKDKDNQQK
jgi:hypothetical protein